MLNSLTVEWVRWVQVCKHFSTVLSHEFSDEKQRLTEACSLLKQMPWHVFWTKPDYLQIIEYTTGTKRFWINRQYDRKTSAISSNETSWRNLNRRRNLELPTEHRCDVIASRCTDIIPRRWRHGNWRTLILRKTTTQSICFVANSLWGFPDSWLGITRVKRTTLVFSWHTQMFFRG
jgi:hypothetical protein